MKNKMNKHLWLVTLALVCAVAIGGFSLGSLSNVTASAEIDTTATTASEDPSPAIAVAQMNATSVVGVITNTQTYNQNTGEVENNAYAQGSGVVIADGGYILTNYHVVEGSGSSNMAYQILMPDSTKVDAILRGYDSSLDLAVLKVDDEAAKQLKPVTVGSSSDLVVGSTVIAIGNPGGEVLANTVTQGIVSALERDSVDSSNTTREVDYIQHDAAINSGNSGGGLFNYKGELVGINTLKYSGSSFSSVSYEGLGFAIPIDTAYPIAMQLVENGKVIRPQMGITVKDQEGPDEPLNNYAPASVCIYSINEGSPAEAAGLKQYDFIYSVNGERVKSFRELSSLLDKYNAGDTVSVTVVRYNNVSTNTYNNGTDGYGNYGNNYGDFFNNFPFGGFGNYFGNYGGYGNNYGSNGNSGSNNNDSTYNSTDGTYTDGTLTVSEGYEFVTVDVTLELPSEDDDQ